MGYSENIIPKYFSLMGYKVHVISSNLNIYGNTSDYDKNYKHFLGKAENKVGISKIGGFSLHRLPHKKFGNYILIKGLINKIRELSPDIIQTISVNSLNTLLLATISSFYNFRLYTENHQHLSVVKPYLKYNKGYSIKRIVHKITRKFPIFISSFFIKKCFAIAPDCFEVSNRIYGIPINKIVLSPLGTDTALFKPAYSVKELKDRSILRNNLGINDNIILCIYTGRFSDQKNPALLAKAIDDLSSEGMPYYGLFIGSGPQEKQIINYKSSIVLPFMKHIELVPYYQISDIGVWPNEESLSMLDAVSSGLPIIVNNMIGEKERVLGNGYMYIKNDLNSLKETLLKLLDRKKRQSFGLIGRKKMINTYSWDKIIHNRINDYKS
jgi:glycosyltransferase involved in cell wall biosynthesis